MKLSLRKAIDAKCKSCIYDRANGGSALRQIEMCTVTTCPLFPVRPVGQSLKAERRKANNGK